MYTFSGAGTKENVIKTGQIVVNFNEENSILLTNRYPETDEEGIANPDLNSTMNFSISSDIVGDAIVNYAIGIVDINEGATLTQDYIKIYATKNGNTASGFTSGAGKTIKSFEGNKIDGFLDSHVIIKDTVTAKQTVKYTIKAWIDENYDLPITDNSNGTNHSNQTTSETFSFKIKVVATDSNLTVKESNLDISGANVPELATNMIPVYYDETTEVWKKANSNNSDETNKWYDYDNKMWANAVTVTETNRDTYMKASVGTPISMDDINTMWVWIPRFSATKNGKYNGATEFACSNSSYTTKETCESNYKVWYPTNPGAFNITFVNKDTAAHDAFAFGTDPISGFWIGKFENSSDTTCTAASSSAVGAGCNLTTIRPKILPNATSWRGASVSTFFYDMQNMTESGNQYGFDKTKDTNLDTHMLKNNEWGAVAYLTQSIYGRCTSSTSCEEVSINNSSNYYTGRSGGAPGSSSITDTTEGTYKYNENKIEESLVEGTGTNVSTTITNDSTYPWTNTDGVYSSSNNGQNSTTATLTYSFTLSSKGVVSFDYSVSSENKYDKMSYTINNGTTNVITGDVISGTSRGTAESNLSYDNKLHILDAGTYTLTFTYSKDSSSASGLDKGYVKNVKVLAGVETITKLGPGGQLASTTGNIYGVYDMSGGAYEYVMGNYNNKISDSQFTTLPNTKYYNKYTTQSAYTNARLQHALTETGNWYGDFASFVTTGNPWFSRGGLYGRPGYAGVFSFFSDRSGDSDAYFGSRLSVTIN